MNSQRSQRYQCSHDHNLVGKFIFGILLLSKDIDTVSMYGMRMRISQQIWACGKLLPELCNLRSFAHRLTKAYSKLWFCLPPHIGQLLQPKLF